MFMIMIFVLIMLYCIAVTGALLFISAERMEKLDSEHAQLKLIHLFVAFCPILNFIVFLDYIYKNKEKFKKFFKEQLTWEN